MGEFQREGRYIVLKWSDLEKIPNRRVVAEFLAAQKRLAEHSVRIPQRRFVVIESDWPEYEAAWRMIEARVTGATIEQPSQAQELWAVHAQGPDDLYAAFSREDAEKHAAELNALPMPEGIAVGAVVVPSPWPAAEHWKYLAEQELEHGAAARARVAELLAQCSAVTPRMVGAACSMVNPFIPYEEMEAALKAAQSAAQPLTYFSDQATECAGCGKRKHTPLRVDWMGGYVCLTCIDEKLEALREVAQAGQVPEELATKINKCLTLAFAEIALYVSPEKCRDPRSRARRASALATEIRAALAAAPVQGAHADE